MDQSSDNQHMFTDTPFDPPHEGQMSSASGGNTSTTITPEFAEKHVAALPETHKHMSTTKKSARFEKWNVGHSYQLNRILGQGSYGEVAEAIDSR